MSENEPLSPEIKGYFVRVLPCQPPCDSYGVCENCIVRNVMHAGYNFGYRADRSELARLKSENLALAAHSARMEKVVEAARHAWARYPNTAFDKVREALDKLDSPVS